jgi:hypothetical protein
MEDVEEMTLEEFYEIFGTEIDPLNFFEEQAGDEESAEDETP